MKELSILFLGASKRVSLLERFVDAAKKLGVQLRLIACERDSRFYPISHLAEILEGPSFLDSVFVSWLEDSVEKHDIDLVIPNMDSATVALSRYAAAHPAKAQCWPVVSSERLCQAMFDKLQSHEFFNASGLPVPPDTPGQYPKIAKPQFGFGAKGIRILKSSVEREAFYLEASSTSCLVEDFLSPATETTVDFYVSPRYGLIGYVLRDRIEVSDGEVMVCRTRPPRPSEKHLIDRVASLPGWQGCITLQYLTDAQQREYVVEVNPRFGGGSTCSIEAGLNMPLYLIAEASGLDFDPPAKLKNIYMTRARRDFFCEC